MELVRTSQRLRRAAGALSALLLVSLLARCSPPSDRPAGSGPANLLVFLLDTTRADHLSCYGYPQPTTPTVDALAAQGWRMDAAYAQSSLTPVSAASLFSGSYPFRHGIRSLYSVNKGELAPEVPTLAELLTRSGRRTAAFVSAQPMGAHYGLARGFELYDDDLSETRSRHGIERFSDAGQRPADETTERVLPWLREHVEQPFALFVHFFDTHDPSFVPPREFLESRVSFELPADLGRYVDPRRAPQLFARENVVELYDAELAYMDLQIARILEVVEAAQKLEDTLVVVVADHGEAFGEHQFWTHGILYEEQLRVPLILRVPGSSGSSSARVRLIDVLPTLAELLDLPAPAGRLDGRSFASLLDAKPEKVFDRVVYSEVHHAPGDRLRRETEMYSLRVSEWKLIHRPVSGAHELYDLVRDPGELDNLYRPDHDWARALEARLHEMGAVGGEVSLEGIPADVLETIRALGY